MPVGCFHLTRGRATPEDSHQTPLEQADGLADRHREHGFAIGWVWGVFAVLETIHQLTGDRIGPSRREGHRQGIIVGTTLGHRACCRTSWSYGQLMVFVGIIGELNAVARLERDRRRAKAVDIIATSLLRDSDGGGRACCRWCGGSRVRR